MYEFSVLINKLFKKKVKGLKGHCHGHFGQTAQIFYKNWFEHELLLQYREENIAGFLFLEEQTIISF